MQHSLKSKDEVQKAFQQLLESYRKQQQQIVTKEEQALLERNKELVTSTAEFTPQAIIKGVAETQWEVATSTETLQQKLLAELQRLDDLRTALTVQQNALKESLDTKIAANALFVLKQEQTQRETALDKDFQEFLQKLEREISDKRTAWEKEQVAFDTELEERKSRLEKERIQELEEYKYQLERTYAVEKDAYEKRKKLLIRKLDEEQRDKEKNWAGREKVLDEESENFLKYKEKVDNFDKELEEKVKDARDKAFRSASRDAKEALELFEKEIAGKKYVAELTIANLEKNIEKQQLEIVGLSAELKEAVAQVQALSVKALENVHKAKLN